MLHDSTLYSRLTLTLVYVAAHPNVYWNTDTLMLKIKKKSKIKANLNYKVNKVN